MVTPFFLATSPTFQNVEEDLKQILTSCAENRKTSTHLLLREIIAKANSLCPTKIGVTLIGGSKDDNTSLQIVFTQLSKVHARSQLGFFYRAMEELGIKPKELKAGIKWEFAQLKEYNDLYCQLPLQQVSQSISIKPYISEDEVTALREKVRLLSEENAALKRKIEDFEARHESIVQEFQKRSQKRFKPK
jgi:uncharacterized protein (DUF952 family)